jgi:hypothetical protein
MPSTDEKLEALERMAVALEAQGKAFMMIFAAVFSTMADNPDNLRRAAESLQVSMRAAAQQNSHVVILSQLAQAVTLLDALASRKN